VTPKQEHVVTVLFVIAVVLLLYWLGKHGG